MEDLDDDVAASDIKRGGSAFFADSTAAAFHPGLRSLTSDVMMSFRILTALELLYMRVSYAC